MLSEASVSHSVHVAVRRGRWSLSRMGGGLHLDRGPHPSKQRPPELTPSGGHCSGQYASYWNAFLLFLNLTNELQDRKLLISHFSNLTFMMVEGHYSVALLSVDIHSNISRSSTSSFIFKVSRQAVDPQLTNVEHL